MSELLDAVRRVLEASWHMLLDMSPWLLLGFLVAGALKVLLPETWIARRLGGRGLGPVTKAALIGVPLPLCSCGVVPAALGLRKQGASRGATLSFLVSTPETGVDSIAVTYAILGPAMAIFRPIAAVLNAITAGWLADVLVRERDEPKPEKPSACACCGEEKATHRHSIVERLRASVRFALDDLLGDIAGWLLFGLLLAGVITAFVSPDLVRRHIGSEGAEMLLMLAISVPLYICATASTPVAAALVVAGVSPGAALVLLLAGPATNVATLLLVGRILGKGAAAVYLGSIAATSVGLGWLLNRLTSHLPGVVLDGTPGEAVPRWLAVVCAAVLLLALGRVFLRRFANRSAPACCAAEAVDV
jgi:uncharacterized membrane protein YraQ (UPF0718 family)